MSGTRPRTFAGSQFPKSIAIPRVGRLAWADAGRGPTQSARPKPSGAVLAALGVSMATSFFVLLPIGPVLAERNGPHGAAGAATAALFIGAVGGELLTPLLASRWTPFRLLMAGQLLNAIPSLAFLSPNANLWQMLAATCIRGLGFGISIVVALALVAELSERSKRGRSIGQFGLAVSAPGIVFPSIGVFLLETGHADLAALIALLSGLAGLLVALRLRHLAVAESKIVTNVFGVLRRPRLLAMLGGFVLVSCSFGAIITYAPIALPAEGLGSAATFLLVSGTLRAASRWLSGVLGDHRPARLIVISGVLLSAAGLVVLAVNSGPLEVILSAAIYGAGYGAVQTGAYLAMTERDAGDSLNAISALWNCGIDLGSSLGGALLGLSVALSNYADAVWLMPAVVLASLPLFLGWPRPPKALIGTASDSP